MTDIPKNLLKEFCETLVTETRDGDPLWAQEEMFDKDAWMEKFPHYGEELCVIAKELYELVK